MADKHEAHSDKDALPGTVTQNGEEQEPTQPNRRRPTEHEHGGGESSGASSEGSQSTGNPNSAG
jgi:hypothetical protein